MSLVAVDSVYFPHPFLSGQGAGGFGTAALIDSSTDRVAIIFRAGFTDTIDQIAVGFGAAPTVANVDYRVETVDTASNATPTGTLWATNTAATNLTPSANTVVAGTLTAGASITRGNMVALVVQETGGGGSIALNVNRFELNTAPLATPSGAVAYGSNNLSGSYSNAALLPVIAVHLSTANKWIYVTPALPLIESFTTVTFTTSTGATTGTRRGIYWTQPYAATLDGMWIKMQTAAAGDFDVILYDAAGTQLQKMLAAYDSSQQRVVNTVGMWSLPFDNTYDLVAATDYRLAIVPTTTNNVITTEFAVNTAAHMGAVPGGINMYLTKFVSSAWAQVTTERVMMGLRFSQLDNGVSGARVHVIGR